MGNEYVCILTSEHNYYLQSLKRLLDDEIIGSRVIILWNDHSLDEVGNNLLETLVNLPIERAIAKYADNPYETVKRVVSSPRVIFWSENVLLAPGNILGLSRVLTKVDSGIITANGENTELLVDDIYAPKEMKKAEGKGAIPVDLASLDLCLMRSKVLENVDFNSKWFGLSLRKLGYQNYLDTTTNIDYEKGENKNAQNNNVEGTPS